MNTLGKIISSLGLAFLSLFDVHPQPLATGVICPAFSPVQSQQFILYSSGVTASQNTVTLTSFQTPYQQNLVMCNFGNIGYGVLEPNSPSKIESISFTGITQNANGSATLTGVNRGLDFIYPYMASSTLQRSHAGGTYFILTNSAAFYGQQFALVNSPATINGAWTFSSTSPPGYDFNPNFTTAASTTLASIGFVASTSYAGTVPATVSTAGIVKMATGLQAASSTANDGTYNYVLGSNLSTSTPGSNATLQIPVSLNDGKLSPNWFNGANENYTFNGTTVLNATTTIAATGTTTAALTLNGLKTGWPSSQSASTTLTNDGQGDLSWTVPDWTLLASSSLASTIATTTVSFPARTDLQIILSAPVVNTNDGSIYMQFNSDTSAIYGYSISLISSSQTITQAGGQKLIVLTTQGINNGSGAYYVINVTNLPGTKKFATWSGTPDANGGNNEPDFSSGAGSYNNSTAITSVSFGTKTSFGVGTTINVFGSKQ